MGGTSYRLPGFLPNRTCCRGERRLSPGSRPLSPSAPCGVLISLLPPLLAPEPPRPTPGAASPGVIYYCYCYHALPLTQLVLSPPRSEPEPLFSRRGTRDPGKARDCFNPGALRPSAPAPAPSCKMGMLAQATLKAQNSVGEGGGHVGPGLSKEGQVSGPSGATQEKDGDSPCRLQSIPGWAKGDAEACRRARGGGRLLLGLGLEPQGPRPAPGQTPTWRLAPRSSPKSGARGLPAPPAGPLLPSGGRSARHRPRR